MGEPLRRGRGRRLRGAEQVFERPQVTCPSCGLDGMMLAAKVTEPDGTVRRVRICHRCGLKVRTTDRGHGEVVESMTRHGITWRRLK